MSSSTVVRRAGALIGALVLLLVAAACRPIPETGLYSSQQYTDTQLSTLTNLQYGTAEDVERPDRVRCCSTSTCRRPPRPAPSRW